MKMPKVLLLLLMVVSRLSLMSQALQSLIPSIPTSPQAEAFKMYGEYAINYSTGAPDISIPLYEINHRGYKIPLILKYSPRPLKPGYNYDVYGQGWGLSLNSSVSRSIEGVPDEWSNFKLESSKFNQYYYTDPYGAASCGSDANCNLEVQPHVNPYEYIFIHDKFNVVLPDGTSFDFIIDHGENNATVFTISDGRQVKILCSYTTANINYFVITDEQGVVYTFAGSDTPYQGPTSTYSSSYVSWQLTRIDLPYTTEPITFSYDYSIQSEFANTCQEPGIRITEYHEPVAGGYIGQSEHNVLAQDVPSYPPYAYKMKLLTAISYGSTLIQLLYRDQTQTNEYNAPAYNYVKAIRVRENSSIIKDIQLDLTIKDVVSYCSTSKIAKLDSVSIRGSDTTSTKEVYRCAYKGMSYYYSGTDHWGYLNSYDISYDVANFNLFVGFDLNEFPYVVSNARISAVTKSSQDLCPYSKIKLSKLNFDNRRPGSPEEHGVLSRLSFPTGGYTEFEFENHRFLTSTDADGNYIFDSQNRVVAFAAGFRIRKIANYTKEGIAADVKNFRYGKTNKEVYPPNHIYATDYPNEHTGLGEAVVDPNILTYMNFTSDFNYGYAVPGQAFIRNMTLGLDPYGEHVSFSNPFVYDGFFQASSWRWECTFNASNFRRIVNGRPPVLYSDVTVYLGEIDQDYRYTPEKTQGKTVYKYEVLDHGIDLLGKERDSLIFEYPHYIGNTIDYFPQSFRYNKLIEKKDYQYNGQDYQLVKEENNKWLTRSYQYTEYLYDNRYPPKSTYPYITLGNLFQTKIISLGNSLLEKSWKIQYSTGGGSLQTVEEYNYNDRDQIVAKSYWNSANKKITQSFSYPELSINSDIIQKMVAKNMISPVVTSTIKVDENNQPTKDVSGSKVDFKEFQVNGYSIIKPAKSYELELKPSGSEYVLRSEIKDISASGNPLEIIAKDGIHSAFIWGYNERYMIAEVKNATSGDIAYSSFETDAKGNWIYTGTISTPSVGTVVPTGRKYYNLTLTSSLDKTVTNGNAYIISYWSNSSNPYIIDGALGTVTKGRSINGWTFFEHKVTANNNVLSISGSGAIDELRLYPSGAQMNTYTYDPLIGMTSQTDANNRTTFYEYDGFGRLTIVRDEDKNILKKYCYNYAGQQEDCSSGCSSMVANWQNTATAIRCRTVKGEYTGEQEQEQQDQNPCSATYQQLRWVVVSTRCTLCPKPQNWQSTGNYRCATDASGSNTGAQEREERNVESCSLDYNVTRWVSNGTNTTSCPLPVTCNASVCQSQGPQYRCVNGTCEMGYKVYTSSTYNPLTGKYECVYHYEWSDGMWSQNYTEYTTSSRACVTLQPL